MKHAMTRLALATTLALGTVAAQAAETFVGMTLGATRSNADYQGAMERREKAVNGVTNDPKYYGTLGARIGQQDSQGRYYLTYEDGSSDNKKNSSYLDLRQRSLLGSYDMFLPLSDRTRLFGGATLGMTRLDMRAGGKTTKFSGSDKSYAAGLQAGVLHDLGEKFALEGGYRYLRSNLDVKTADKQSGMTLRNSHQVYMGVNYRF